MMSAWDDYKGAVAESAKHMRLADGGVDRGEFDWHIKQAEVWATLALAHATAATARQEDK
jgi:hypothetical protein